MVPEDQLSLFSEASPSHQTSEPLVVDSLPVSGPIPDGSLFIIRNYESRYLTHTFHRYPGKFIPAVPRWAMNRHLEQTPSLVLDPFVGSGTTLVEALLAGHRGFGVDVDPLARLISKVKITPLPVQTLQKLLSDFETALRVCPSGSFLPATPNIDHWFTPEAIHDLSRIREVIFSYQDDRALFDFLLVCFSSILRRVSNADNETMKTYVSHTNPKAPEPPVPLFFQTLQAYVSRLLELGECTKHKVLSQILPHDDACSLSQTWDEHKLPEVDLVVTSPPYIKSVDYLYNQMVELFWIGDLWDLDTRPKQNEYKRRYLGNDRVLAKEILQPRHVDCPEVDAFVKRIRTLDAKLGVVMERYFQGLYQHLLDVRKILRTRGKYVLVIGDSVLAGVSVPTHSLALALARRCGFQLESYFGYEIRNRHMRFPRGGRGGTVPYDWVLTLDNVL